eukprot:gene1229-1351_t
MADKNQTNSVSKSSKKLNCKATSDEKAKNFCWNTEMQWQRTQEHGSQQAGIDPGHVPAVNEESSQEK